MEATSKKLFKLLELTCLPPPILEVFYFMKILFFAVGLISVASCSKKEQTRSFKNVAYTIETTVLKDGTTLSVVNNPSFSK